GGGAALLCRRLPRLVALARPSPGSAPFGRCAWGYMLALASQAPDPCRYLLSLRKLPSPAATYARLLRTLAIPAATYARFLRKLRIRIQGRPRRYRSGP